ncbi:hypothetical protein KOI35_28060 [Actinoplanes bogorensis]|uniref:Ig-like domain repeat protein n=1 Tax=Paractinoplanes bogorensis TaxID=1610840 RepID=A0ABS5YV89_9ACTN|nr:hypothetical protein [Actinoplanes bogorensis]MBU2667372.1 hypothetical protein [Actinoplanes bogorensis]
MSNRFVRATLSAALVAGSTAFALSAAAPAHAVDLSIALPLTSFGDIVVNDSDQRIYVSDPTAGKLYTLDFAGVVKNTSTNLPGINALLVNDDLVYAAVPDKKSVDVFNALGNRINSFTATADVRPTSVAVAGGRVWFGEADGGIGRVDPNSEDADDLIPDVVTVGAAPLLTGAGTLLAASAAGSVTVVDAATTTPVPVAAAEVGPGTVQDLAFTGSGGNLLAAGTGGLARAVKPQDLSTIRDYTAAAENNAVSVRTDGVLAVGSDRSVAVFSAGASAATKQFTLKGTGALQPGGLAWQSGGPRLFGVSHNDDGYALQIFGDPSSLVTGITLTAPAKLELGGTATIAGTFASPIPEGQQLVITRKDATGSRRVGPTTVPVGGKFSIADKPTRSGSVTYTVTFAGGNDFAPASATRTFAVGTTRATTLTLDRNGSSFPYGSTVTLTAKLGSTYTNKVVEIWADPFGGDQANRLVRKATVNSKGLMTASFKVTRNTTFSAIFRGDTFTTARTVKSTVSTKASVSTTIGKHYKIAKIGSVSYYHVRRTVHPEFTTRIPSYPGRLAYLTLEVYNGREWKLWQAGYFALTSGRVVTKLQGTHTAGVKYRIRAAYQYGKSGDTLNASNWGTYQHFTFTK